MSAVHQTNPSAHPSQNGADTILVVDDSRAQRRLVVTYLSRWGFRVQEAGSGEEALEICRMDPPDVVVSDWLMPGMSGVEFCSRYRAEHKDRYGYFILLTSKTDKGELSEGLEVGADDFLTKPFNSVELKARIGAGQRILRMERELKEKNRMVSATLAEMQVLYDALDRDLIEARKLQQSLVRDRFSQFNGADISLMLQPAGHVGGDLVGLFQVSEDELGFYALDVSGHGIASALLTARLAAHLSGSNPRQNIALRKGKNGSVVMRKPSEAISSLNQLVLDEIETEHYFTMLLGRLDLRDGSVTLSQAGHPHPVIQQSDGKIRFCGEGGLPVGLISGAAFSDFELTLNPGDRLFLGSDGITECAGQDGCLLDDDGLQRLLEKNQGLRGPKLLEALLWDLATFADDTDFADDISGVLIEFSGRR